MKPIDEQDHYEVLEVPPGAGYEDIERAYQLTRAAYTDGSMALYSIFDKKDAAVIRGRIDEAYRVLADPNNRKRYDDEVGVVVKPGEVKKEAPPGKVAEAQPSTAAEYERSDLTVTAELSEAIEVIEDPEADIDEENQDYDGAALRRARLRRGIELNQIADVTKVSVKFLTNLEDEAFDELPASVYVRGFVNAYARAIGLDSRRVAATYMVKVDAVRNPPRRQPRSSSR